MEEGISARNPSRLKLESHSFLVLSSISPSHLLNVMLLVWFSQTQCAVIKLEPKRFSSSYKLTWEDLPNLTRGFSSVSGEKVNGEELDDLDMPVRWHFDFRDKNREYVSMID